MSPKAFVKLAFAVVSLAVAGEGVALYAQGASAGAKKAPAAEHSTASAESAALGTVRIPRQVMADGKPLAAGTYSVRLTSDPVTSVVGQSRDAEHWVEFLQGGTVKGRELATVESSTDVKGVAKIRPPAPGASKIQVLKGADYLRVWINQAGTHYLVHLPTGSTSTAAR